MPKTKEEVQNILVKNYERVQKKELDVYDKKDSLNKGFVKSAKELMQALTAENKVQTQEDKDIQAKYKSQLMEIIKKDNEHQKDVERRRQAANKVNEASLADNLSKEKAAIKKVETQIAEISKDYEALVLEVQAQFDTDIETSKKTIININEKGVKDQNTFDTKIADLKSKHETKIQELDEKEATKIEKLTEASNEKVGKLNESIVDEKEKSDKDIATQKQIYLEELDEIEEKMADVKEEYDSKHASIRDSADKRIAVREKHLHRAMDENDSRSVKQHKKDIEKYRKEADKDLLTLRKDYNSNNAVAIDYRKNFIKENYEKFALLERQYTKVKEDKLLEIDQVNITLHNDVENTKLEFEKEKADELQKYNTAFSDTRVKQTEVAKQQELDLVTEEYKQIDLKIVFDKDNAVNDSNNKYSQEAKQKELRDITIEKTKDDELAKNVLDNETATLDNELAIASIELNKDKQVNSENEQIELHGVQHKRHVSAKEEFLTYQQTLEPLFTGRAEEILAYEELEINNRFNIKLAFIEDERKKVESDYKVVIDKINDVFEKERVHFDENIKLIAGPEQDSLDEYLEQEQEVIAAKKAKINSLDTRKDKKELRVLEDELEDYELNFASVKAQKEAVLNDSVGVFKQALHAAEARKNKATEEFTNFKDQEISRINNTVDALTNAKDTELENAKNAFNNRQSGITGFVNNATTRNQNNTEENQAFLDARVESQEKNINAANATFESTRESYNNEYNSLVSSLADSKQASLNKAQNELATEEKNLESFKNDIDNSIATTESSTVNKQKQEQENHMNKANGIKQEFANKVSEIENVLSEQTSAYNAHLQDLQKRTGQEKANFENEKKRVQKEYEQRHKDAVSEINAQLHKDIQNIE